MNKVISIIAVSLFSTTLVGIAGATEVQEKQKELMEKKQEVKEIRQELNQATRKEFVEINEESNEAMQQVSRASKIIGTAVKNPTGENLGDIKDLVINPLSGRMVYAVVSFGGIFGVGDKLFAIPFKALQWNGEKEQYILDMDKKTLKDAPGFDQKHWPDSVSKWDLQREQLNQFYRVNP